MLKKKYPKNKLPDDKLALCDFESKLTLLASFLHDKELLTVSQGHWTKMPRPQAASRPKNSKMKATRSALRFDDEQGDGRTLDVVLTEP